VTIDAPGGGGCGNPLEREPEMVQQDVIEGYVTVERARTDYGVAIIPGTYEIDWEQTGKIRGSKGPRVPGSE
jgi:N-methylhydantoinase B